MEIDHVYRVHTAYTRKAKLPPEIIIKFTRGVTRDSVLQLIRDKDLEFKGNTIQILGKIPWKVQQLCKEYYYKWLFPEA